MLLKLHNCGVPEYGIRGLGGFSLFVVLVALLINVFVARTTTKESMLRRLSVAAVATNVWFAAMLLDVCLVGYMTAQAYVFYILAVISTCVMVGYLLLSILLPVSRINRKLEFRFVPWRRFWLIVVPGFISLGLSFSFIGAFTIAGNDEEYNRWVIGQAIIFVVMVLVATPAFVSFTNVLIKALEQTLALGERIAENGGGGSDAGADDQTSATMMPSSTAPILPATPTTPRKLQRFSSSNDADRGAATETRKKFVRSLLAKIRFIRVAFILACCFLFTMALVTFVILYRFGTVPLFWAVFLSSPLGVGLFTVEVAFYNRKEQRQMRRKSLLPFIMAEKIGLFGQKLSGISFRNSLGKSPLLYRRSDSIKSSQYLSAPDQLVAGGGDLVNVPSTVHEEPSVFNSERLKSSRA